MRNAALCSLVLPSEAANGRRVWCPKEGACIEVQYVGRPEDKSPLETGGCTLKKCHDSRQDWTSTYIRFPSHICLP